MYETFEKNFSEVSKSWQDFVLQNISQKDEIICCYALHDKGFLIGDKWGIVVLTRQ